ncbi:hypothetical protein [Brevibacillus sp. HB2.2]|nr:hypothetical protein [Brevibacillus sp. HB2.2]NRS51968.1 hypothetical protein [Brevibacillus sp. HB2.2]
MELTKEQLEQLPDNSIVVMGCRDCEGRKNIKKKRHLGLPVVQLTHHYF